LIVVNESDQGAVAMQITTVGLDIAKNVFQVHGIDAAEKVVVRKQLRRGQILGFFEALPLILVTSWSTNCLLLAKIFQAQAISQSLRRT
jgi:hypothetical protein